MSFNLEVHSTETSWVWPSKCHSKVPRLYRPAGHTSVALGPPLPTRPHTPLVSTQGHVHHLQPPRATPFPSDLLPTPQRLLQEAPCLRKAPSSTQRPETSGPEDRGQAGCGGRPLTGSSQKAQIKGTQTPRGQSKAISVCTWTNVTPPFTGRRRDLRGPADHLEAPRPEGQPRPRPVPVPEGHLRTRNPPLPPALVR